MRATISVTRPATLIRERRIIANSVAFAIDPASATKSYTISTPYVAYALRLRRSRGGLIEHQDPYPNRRPGPPLVLHPDHHTGSRQHHRRRSHRLPYNDRYYRA